MTAYIPASLLQETAENGTSEMETYQTRGVTNAISHVETVQCFNVNIVSHTFTPFAQAPPEPLQLVLSAKPPSKIGHRPQRPNLLPLPGPPRYPQPQTLKKTTVPPLTPAHFVTKVLKMAPAYGTT